MCGICGKLNFDPGEPADSALISRMTGLLHHRGPDGGGDYCSGPVGLGHRRLSIIDISTGGQPISNEDASVWIVYNGEVYNFPELRSELQARGHIFKSATDTEVIVHLYEELGPDCVKRLRGMFAFAIWDQRKQQLLLARDRVGIKPLYYVNTGKALIFGSEIKALLADGSVQRMVNPRALDRFLTYYYLPGTETLFEGIFKLEPGCYLTARDGKVVVRQYWDLEFPARPGAAQFEDAVASLQQLLRRTVKDHMISDVPVGVLLSGGVDSTGVLRYAVEQTDKPVRTFTVGFEGREFADERPYARMAAERYGTIHQDITLTPDDFRDFLPQYVWHMEEPVCEPPAIALYFVSRLARQSSVKVLLSGEGGDEAFGGYSNYRNLLWLESAKSALGPAKDLLRAGFWTASRLGVRRLSRYANLVHPPLAEYYYSRTATPLTPFNKLKRELYTSDFAQSVAQVDAVLPTRRLFDQVRGASILNRMLYIDTKSWLPDDLLIKADKMTMATSVELRVPLLDHQVLEFAASLPAEFKVRGAATKRILKAALRDSVPTPILERKKTGFPVPYDHWLRNDLRGFLMDTVLGSRSALQDYFRQDKLRELVLAHQADGRGAKEVFSLLVLELLLRRFTAERI